ncbi:MAG: DNA mismatch repair endonuclease MutL, partial [Clostridia bacterium]|nr:DNA mismatch repair endonuclease MutL [Clostridia bacterium]
MGKICELDFHVANLIAAGEVVERPASVIKELLENAIDSGADNISVEIKNGGISFMRVTDNGCGMEPDDVPVSIRRHATSKIRNAQDLNSISTLGFRGEALAAIASVSTLRILTKTKNAQVGTSLESENGKITSVFETGAPVGTTVIVENLFANVPARYKFLKRNITEAMAVSSVVEKIALSHPEISINYIIDGERKISTPGDGILKNAVWAVLGADFAKNTLPLRNSSEGVGISGIIGSQTNYRSNRNMQIFFINHRIIVNRTASAALEQAFSSYIPSDKFPCCVINIELNPALVDVNVHPSKTEVKF